MTATPLPCSSPDAQGVDPSGVSAFLDAVESATDIELHSLMLIRHGLVVAQGWWSPYAPEIPHLLYSLSKSFTSTAAGFAVAEGLLDLDATVLSYFPELDDEITDPRSRAMQVRHIAAMASGHLEETFDRAMELDRANLVRGFLLIPPDREPGSVFAYNQPCTYALAAIVQRLSGQTLIDYLRPRLFEPLGITRVGWQQHPRGQDIGFSGLHGTTDAIARMGLLYLQRGVWEGTRLLPEDWVAEATRVQVANPDEPNPDWRRGYGFQFWRSRHGYRGDGAFGQFCLVLPELDAVIAITAQTENMQAVLDAVWAHLLPAMTDQPVEHSSQIDQLSSRLAGLALPSVAGQTTPEASDVWSDVTFKPTGGICDARPTLTGVRVRRDDDAWLLTMEDDGVELTAPVGAGAWRISEAAGVPLAVSGAWTDPDTMTLQVIFIETPHRLDLTCHHTTAEFRAAWSTAPLRIRNLSQLRMPG